MLIDIIKYFFISGVEYYAIMCLIFSLFRLNTWKKHNQFFILVVVIVLNLSTIANIYIINNEFYYSTILIVLSCIFISLYIRTKKLSTSFLSLLGLGLYLIIQTFVMGLFLTGETLSRNSLTEISTYGQTVQLVSSFIVLIFSMKIKKENSGYSFDLHTLRSQLFALMISILCPVITIVLFSIQELDKLSIWFISVSVMSLITFILYSNYKESKQY